MVSASRSGIRFPSLRLHKASGQAVVTVRGRDIYCGRYGTPEADETYRRVIAELVSSGPEVVRHHGLAKPGRGQHAFTPPTRRPITVAELLLDRAGVERILVTGLAVSRDERKFGSTVRSRKVMA